MDLAPADMLPRVSRVHDLHGTWGGSSDHQSADRGSSVGWPTLDSETQVRFFLVETLEPDDFADASLERLAVYSIHC